MKKCKKCNCKTRFGRWSHKELEKDEIEKGFSPCNECQFEAQNGHSLDCSKYEFNIPNIKTDKEEAIGKEEKV